MDGSSVLRDTFDSPGEPSSRISRHAVMLVIIGAIVVWGINALVMQMISREPPWKETRQQLAQEEEQRMADWQKYENTEYGFSFEQPPMTKRTDCTANTVENDCLLNVMFGTENFKEIVAVREADAPTKRFFFGVLLKQNLSGDLRTYVVRQSEILKNIARNADRNDTSEYIAKDVKIDGVAGYVIETVTTDQDQPNRRFFIPLGKSTVLLILEIDKKRTIDDMLATVTIHSVNAPKITRDNQTDSCDLLSDAAFQSMNTDEVGLGPNGPAMGYWRIMFKGGNFRWGHSDVTESGSYTCEQNVLQVKLFDRPSTATYDANRNVLLWEGVEYKKVE